VTGGRRVYIDQDGSSITVAAGEDEPLEFHVVEGEGWNETARRASV
jgi:hypothetical protein